MKKIIIIIVIISAATLITALAISRGGNQNLDIKTSQAVESASGQKGAPVVKEFTMESFVEFVDGQPKPQFSPKEIAVNTGDLVRLNIMVTKGIHDFKIDEYGVYADTQLNREFTVEFLADKAGEFTYYCTKPGHRQAGHWGTLKVIE